MERREPRHRRMGNKLSSRWRLGVISVLLAAIMLIAALPIGATELVRKPASTLSTAQTA